MVTGLLAASAGVFTKAAGDSDHFASVACALLPENVASTVIMVVLYGLMVGCNVGMFYCFNATLQKCDTTIVASVSCTAANIMFSVRSLLQNLLQALLLHTSFVTYGWDNFGN